MAEVVWTLEALDDLEAIGAFYERTSPQYAASLVERLYEAPTILEDHIRLGRKVPEIDHNIVTSQMSFRARVSALAALLILISFIFCQDTIQRLAKNYTINCAS